MASYDREILNGELPATTATPITGNLPGNLVFGSPGKSAYQVAVDNGFEGSAIQWLESLVGPKGKDGKDYILTPEDIQEISGIVLPHVSKDLIDRELVPWQHVPTGMSGCRNHRGEFCRRCA